jgi:hypothetical protein
LPLSTVSMEVRHVLRRGAFVNSGGNS